MKLLDKLTANPIQKYTVITEEGDRFTLDLRFLPSQAAWEASIEWGSVLILGISLVLSPNLLFGFRNILPFGLLVSATNGIEPAYLDDFTTGRIKLYVMTENDLAELDEKLPQ